MYLSNRHEDDINEYSQCKYNALVLLNACISNISKSRALHTLAFGPNPVHDWVHTLSEWNILFTWGTMFHSPGKPTHHTTNLIQIVCCPATSRFCHPRRLWAQFSRQMWLADWWAVWWRDWNGAFYSHWGSLSYSSLVWTTVLVNPRSRNQV